MKITSGDVMSRVCRLFHYGFPAVASLSTTGKCLVSRTVHYVSKACCLLLILTLFLLFEQPSSKVKYSIIKVRSKIIVSLSFVQ